VTVAGRALASSHGCSAMASPFARLVASVAPGAGRRAAVIPQSWMQGRTCYGGITAALALEGALHELGSTAPPIRSAMLSFVGPASGNVEVESTILRRGASMAFVRSAVNCGGGIATEAIFAFGAARETALPRLSAMAPPPHDVGVVSPDFAFEGRPPFMDNFDICLVRGDMPCAGVAEVDNVYRIRHVGAGSDGLERVHPATRLLALADAPPAALFSAATEPPKVSTATWSVHFMSEDLSPAEGGWYTLQTRLEAASNGYSTHETIVWGLGEAPLLVSRQTVAYF